MVLSFHWRLGALLGVAPPGVDFPGCLLGSPRPCPAQGIMGHPQTHPPDMGPGGEGSPTSSASILSGTHLQSLTVPSSGEGGAQKTFMSCVIRACVSRWLPEWPEPPEPPVCPPPGALAKSSL